MSEYIPEITTKISVEIETDSLDSDINYFDSDDILSQLGIAEEFKEIKNSLDDIKEPIGNSIAESLKSNQELIIQSRHYKSGMMGNNVDIFRDGDSFLVGNTARSADGFPYPLSIELGRKEIIAKPGGVLRWFDGGVPVFSKYSSATSPDPFVEPSIDTTMDAIDTIINDFLKEV